MLSADGVGNVADGACAPRGEVLEEPSKDRNLSSAKNDSTNLVRSAWDLNAKPLAGLTASTISLDGQSYAHTVLGLKRLVKRLGNTVRGIEQWHDHSLTSG